MNSSNSRPKWWLLYLTFPLLILLFIFDHRLKISTGGHEAIQLGIILFVYGLIYGWVKANSRAISQMDQRGYGTFRVIRITPSQLPEAGDERHPMLRLPDSEVRGLLSETFEMDCSNADALSIDDISQEINKE